jgi:hypothetical protein
MPVELQGAVALRKALKQYAPDLAKETQKEIAGHLRKVIVRARGFVPFDAPLSGWGNDAGDWAYRAFDARTVKKGLGFRSLAKIFNSSAAGAIYETAGRKTPGGLPPSQMVKKYRNGRFIMEREGGKDVNKSANPNAGKQFIAALPPLVDSQQSNSAGRRTRKTKGRLLFRAWAEDQGRTTAAVVKAIQSSNQKVVLLTKGAGNRTFRARSNG